MTITITRGIPNVTAEWVPLKRVPHRHTDRRRPPQNPGAEHIRGVVRRARLGATGYTVAVINTATDRVLNGDGPYCCITEAYNEAAWRVQAVREAWSMGIAKKKAVRDR